MKAAKRGPWVFLAIALAWVAAGIATAAPYFTPDGKRVVLGLTETPLIAGTIDMQKGELLGIGWGDDGQEPVRCAHPSRRFAKFDSRAPVTFYWCTRLDTGAVRDPIMLPAGWGS